MINHTIALDMRKRPGAIPPRITLRRGESQTQKITATLTDDGAAYSPTYTSARLCTLHADGTWARVAATKSGSTVYATLDGAAINGTGRCRLAYFEFYSSNGYSETTQNFELVLLADVDGSSDASRSYDNELDALYKKWSEYEGKAEAAESARAAAEATRATDEAARAAAETARAAAETARESASATAVANAETATEAAQAAADAIGCLSIVDGAVNQTYEIGD